jgi:hypothetical protein
MATEKQSEKKGEGKAEGGARDRALVVPRTLKKMGAVSPEGAVPADAVIEKLKDAGFNAGNVLYRLRHAEPPVTARAEDADGVRKRTYLTEAGLKVLAAK